MYNLPAWNVWANSRLHNRCQHIMYVGFYNIIYDCTWHIQLDLTHTTWLELLASAWLLIRGYVDKKLSFPSVLHGMYEPIGKGSSYMYIDQSTLLPPRRNVWLPQSHQWKNTDKYTESIQFPKIVRVMVHSQTVCIRAFSSKGLSVRLYYCGHLRLEMHF